MSQLVSKLELVSGRNVLLGGIGIFLLWAVGSDVVTFVKKKFAGPPPVPVCYSKASAYYVAGTKALPSRGTPSSDARGDATTILRIKDVSRVCTVKSCEKEQLADYRSTLNSYLEHRASHMRRLDIAYGDAGLVRARQLYRTPDDIEIEQGLRERYQAKVFLINEGSHNEAVLRILLARGPEALRPCRKDDAR